MEKKIQTYSVAYSILVWSATDIRDATFTLSLIWNFLFASKVRTKVNKKVLLLINWENNFNPLSTVSLLAYSIWKEKGMI